eukprot:TRINITY_DN964_c0_g1_i1.p1 TRINITY_DN964_c0_g1~~TRINITY_DN964_c0_g1_i1.p1  ORF type:complete len:321 (-),score=32.29 TRINITY_DN964_c0_g1_i1:121-1083(-)
MEAQLDAAALLPAEIWALVVDALPRGIDDLLSLSLVNRMFYRIAGSDRVWQPLCDPAWDVTSSATTAQHQPYKKQYMDWLRTSIKQYQMGFARMSRRIDSNDIEYLVKLVITGDHTTGKSGLLNRLICNRFIDEYRSTREYYFGIYRMMVGSLKVKTQIWDSGRSPAHGYYRGAHGVILVYDVTNEASFDGLQVWWEEAKRCLQPNARIMLIGTKNDLVSKKVIETERAQAWALDHQCLFAEVSSCTGQGVKDAFNLINSSILGYNDLESLLAEGPMFVPSQVSLVAHGIVGPSSKQGEPELGKQGKLVECTGTAPCVCM